MQPKGHWGAATHCLSIPKVDLIFISRDAKDQQRISRIYNVYTLYIFMAMNFYAPFVPPATLEHPFSSWHIKNYIALRKLTSDLATPFIARQHVNVARGFFNSLSPLSPLPLPFQKKTFFWCGQKPWMLMRQQLRFLILAATSSIRNPS